MSITSEQQEQLEKFLCQQGANFQKAAAAAPYTRFKIGGLADFLVFPKTVLELATLLEFCHQHKTPCTVLGCGSNVLISDRGVSGALVILANSLAFSRVEGEKIYTGAGAKLCDLAALAARNGLSGLEFASGIPGSIGGAIFMNAGAYDGDIHNVVKSTTYIRQSGEIGRLVGEEHEFSYRHSIFNTSLQDVVIAEAVLKLTKAPCREIYARMATYALKRYRSQPLEKPSAGSAFKRPPGYFAGKLIADAGLKGYRWQNAGVSDKHAGFIVQFGGASAANVRFVFAYVQKIVKEKFGVELAPEVKFLGDFQQEDICRLS